MVKMKRDIIEQLRACPIFKSSSPSDGQDSLDSSLMTYSLVSVYHDTVYLWHRSDRKLYNIDVKDCGRNDLPLDYKTLVLTSTPYSVVGSVRVSADGRRVLLYGSRCITVVELPGRWPPVGAPQGDRVAHSEGANGHTSHTAAVTCVSHHVAERFLLCTSHVTVVKADWHPDSPGDCHLVVLCSDNYIRVYDVSADVQTPCHVVAVGPTSSAFLGSSVASLSFVGSMGDTAVAFDFGPAQAVGQCRPIYLLRGNGDVLILQLDINSKRSSCHALSPPLAMLPSVEDNYGTDACDLLCVTGIGQPAPPPSARHTYNPTVLIVATPHRIYHCVVMDEESDDNSVQLNGNGCRSETNSGDDNRLLTPSTVCLYIYECVELKMALLSPRPASTDQSQPFDLIAPVRLHRDPASDYRYYCTHLYGAHCVSVPLIPALQRYCKLEDESDEPLGEHPAQVAHLLCTDPTGSQSSLPASANDSLISTSASNSWRPVLGLCIVTPATVRAGVASSQTPLSSMSQAPPLLLLLLHDHSPVLLPCERRFLLEVESCQTAADLPVASSESCAKTSTESHVRRLLERSDCQPHLHSSSEPPLSQQLQLLSSSSCLLRSEYIRRQRSAGDWLQTSCSGLQQLYNQQVEQMKLLEGGRKQLRERAESLAERYHELMEQQETFKKRIDTVSCLANLSAPTLSDSERQLMENVSTINKTVSEVLSPAVKQVLTKYNYQKDKITASNQAGRSSSALSSSQTRSVRQILAKEGDQIAELVKWVNAAKQVLGA